MKCNASGFMRDNRFTLVELLVIIAIVAILAALLLPVLRSAQDHAERVVCGNNLSQINTAMTAYADDNHGFYCDYYAGDNSWPYSGYRFWMLSYSQFYQGYLPAGKSMYYCAAGVRKISPGSRMEMCYASFPGTPGGYSEMSYCYFAGARRGTYMTNNYDGRYSNGRKGPVRTSQIVAPARTTIFADLMKFNENAPYEIFDTVPNRSWNHMELNADSLLTGNPGGNLAYADGHLRWITGVAEMLRHRQEPGSGKSYCAEQPSDK